ncbi:MAG: hypothetical protein HZA29_05205, partial [Candidatus Omnitrophica bacterium]|nr:hypothetical protein [Candidatus Omnitrophota bacterium]
HWSRAAAAREIGVTTDIVNVWLDEIYPSLRQQQRRERHAYLAGVIREAASQSLGREEIAFSIGVSTITLSNEISKLEKDLKPSASLLSDLWQRDLENLAMLFNRIKERAGADHIVLYEELRREKQEFLDQVSGQKGLLKAPSLITVRNNILSAEGRKSGVFELFRKQFADMADEAGGELAKIVGKMGREPKDTIPVRLLLKPYGVLKADKDRPSPGRGAGRPARKEDRLAALIREFSNPAPGAARPADIEEDLKRRPRLVIEAMQRILGDNVDHWQAYPRLAPIFLDAFAVIEENPGELLEDIYVYLNVNRIISQPLLSRQVLAFKRLEAFSKIYPEEFVRQIKSWQEASEGKDVYQMLIVKRFLDGPGGKLYEHALRAVRRPATPENGPSQAPQQREEQTFPQEPPTDVYAAEAHGLMREIGDVNDAHRYREIRASLPGLVKKLVILSEKSPTARKYLTRLLGMAHNGVGTLAREIYAQGREEKKSSSPVGKTREDRREMRDDRLSSLVIRPSFREFIRALWFEDYYYWLWYKMTRRARKAREQVVFNVPEALKKAGAISDVRFSLSRSPDRNAVDRREGNGRWSMVDGQTAEVSPPVGAVVHASEQAKGSPLEQDWYRFYTNKLDPLTPNHEKYFPWFVANFMDPDKTDWQEFRQQVEADPGSPWQTVLVRVREEEGHHVVASKERGIKRADFSESVYLFQ